MSATVVVDGGDAAEPVGVVAWLTTTDHKRIGILYLVTTFTFFLLGGIFAGIMRAQLTAPNEQLVGRQTYNELFTMHGTIMIFLFVAPFGFGLANYLLPLQVGAPDVAFPRLNAISYWMFLLGGLIVLSGFLTAGGAASAGWTSYTPLSEQPFQPGLGMDLWIVGLLVTSVSGILTAVNLLTTAILMRAPGMIMWRLPIFTWNTIVTLIMVLVAFPSIAVAFGMLFIDRRLGGQLFDPSAGGSPILYQHLFWFFGHPEVYIMVLPFFGVITEIVPVFSRKRLFGYTGFVLATLLIAGYSMTVWAHHMFTTGAVENPFFSAMSFLIAVPTGIKFFNWIGTMWRGRIWFSTPMLFCLAFLGNFLIGGITGVMVASPPLDYHFQDTYFVVAHLHSVLMGGSVFAIFAAIAFWFPKITGAMLRESVGKVAVALMFVGFNLTFTPMYLLGLRGMPRRVATYDPGLGWTTPNLVATVGYVVLALGVLVFLGNVVVSLVRRIPAGADPWGGYSLEWATSSPPPEHNFERLPRIRSERPAYDEHHAAREVSERIEGERRV
ncbi:MAG TPA: cytochrome c oxidase subunit I [Actinomycetota bacterium]|nr:cytochrome c oxidase subunit I [Actinomycetota bacterium]